MITLANPLGGLVEQAENFMRSLMSQTEKLTSRAETKTAREGPGASQGNTPSFARKFLACGAGYAVGAAKAVAAATAVALPFSSSAAITVVPGGTGIVTGYAMITAEGFLGALSSSAVLAPAAAIVGGIVVAAALSCVEQALQ
jgi:hypothetical protein